jgi:hydrogenase maturation protease
VSVTTRADVRILVCGSADRGDDGAALSAVARYLPTLGPELCARIEVRRCVQLDPADLLDVRPDELCMVLDTVTGVDPGSVVRLALDDLGSSRSVVPRSSHALPVGEALAVVRAVRGGPIAGTFLGLGGKWFGYGDRTSRAVRDGLPAYIEAIDAELRRLLAATRPG